MHCRLPFQSPLRNHFHVNKSSQRTSAQPDDFASDHGIIPSHPPKAVATSPSVTKKINSRPSSIRSLLMSRFRHACFLIAFMQACALAFGGPPSAIPRKHEWERYEPNFARNPFVARTLPTMVADVGLADFALVGYYGALENPTLVVANIKTHERFRLKIGEEAPAGFVIRSFQLAGSAEEKFVEVSRDGQQSRLAFAQSYVQQLAAKSDEQSSRLRQQQPQHNTPSSPARTGAAPQPNTLHSPATATQTATAAGATAAATSQTGPAAPPGLLQAPTSLAGTGSTPVVSSPITPRPAPAPGQRVLIPPASP